MTDPVRLIDGIFSEGLETVTQLVRRAEFSGDLGKCIRQEGGAERAVLALRREFFAQQSQIVIGGRGGAYRSGPSESLPSDHVLVPCRYSVTPSRDELKKTFKGGVSTIFDGRRWRKHALAIAAGEIPGDKVIWLAAPPTELLSDGEAIIAWGMEHRTEFAPNGYYPMMGQHELIDLHQAHPGLCKRFWMPALGSFVADGDAHRGVAMLGADGDGPILYVGWFDNGWYSGHRVPLVRK